MTRKQQLKLDVITKIIAEKINHKIAASILGVSLRTIGRYLKSYKEKGVRFIYHGNTGRIPPNKYSEEFINNILSQVKEKYFDLNVTHLNEVLEEKEKIIISYTSLLGLLKRSGMIRKIKVRYRKARYARQRTKNTGVLLQMDGSYHKWFGGKDSCLITAIDDCNNDIYYGGFYKSETTLACMDVLKKIIERRGKFEVLYVDRAGTYGGGKRQLFSNIQRACEELGILVMFANCPEGKGRIERLFRTLQDRLIPEMRLANVKTKREADAYFDFFINNQYRKFVLSSHEQSYFSTIDASVDLNEIFCIKERRTVNKDHTFQKDSIRYLIKNVDFSLAKREIEIRTYISGSMKFYYMGKELQVEEFIDYLEAA